MPQLTGSAQSLQLRDSAGGDPFGDKDVTVFVEAGVVRVYEAAGLPEAYVAPNPPLAVSTNHEEFLGAIAKRDWIRAVPE